MLVPENGGLRVLQVAHTRRGYGGLERQVLALATGLRDAGHSVVMATPRASWLSERANRAGIRCVPVRFRGLGDPLSHYRIQRIARSEKVDIIHGHSRAGIRWRRSIPWEPGRDTTLTNG